MTGTIRRRGPDITGTWLSVLLLITNLVTVLLLPSIAGALLAAKAGRHPTGAELLRAYGDPNASRFPPPAVIALSVGLLLLLAAIDVPLLLHLRDRDQPRHVDSTARLWTRRADTLRVGTKSVRAAAEAIGYPVSTPGVYIGRSVRDGRDLWGSWEEVHVDISGPRTGKTSCRVIPNIVSAPGAVVITSCKRDVVDATREVRRRQGRVWVFDPHNVVGEPPTWFWNPLDMVAGSMKEAASVAGLIAFTQREQHMRSDGYFQPAAENLLAMFLLAASLDEQPITVVRRWLLRPNDEPATILRASGYALAAEACEATRNLPTPQRAGVYGTAIQMVSWLAAPEVLPWITPGQGREQFLHFEDFAIGTDTLYVVSDLDDRSAKPAASLLTAAILAAAEYRAAACSGGRLPVPFLVVLDEAANIAPLPILPDRLSHYGSRGLVVMVMLQSWAQGAHVWGENGMAKIWNAGSVRVYGAGGSEGALLSAHSLFSGKFEASTTTLAHRSTAWWGSAWWDSSVTRATRPEFVLGVADLAALPRDRMLVQISGGRPLLVRSVPWWEGPHADAIRASIGRHGP
ncbi:type IV secretory system conjugative DNA transfer family protein [Embleya sp. NBC_00896]|uniref:type IV secretory system conjugative DNA transfer family protein n=1 Tax=Embleya sp. NBC_00896 TaxID=2975961 RepID=UPI00386F510C|nr:type IV secretory system conjugative DNA transfer family protein [Embleya sp. NBC_00896]